MERPSAAAQSAEMHTVGDLLGANYRIDRLLAIGGMSRLYAGQRLDDQHPVVIKMVRHPEIHTRELARQLSERLALCLKLKHPFLARVLDSRFFPEIDQAVLIMEYIEGPSLREYYLAEFDRITVGRILEIFQQVALGVDCMHAEGVIHRDIKPDNILLEKKTGIPRIVDYGLALGCHEIQDKAEPDAFGSPAYMAPEQVIGTSFGPEVDVYSLAMCLYTLLTRTLAFDVSTTRELTLAHVHLDPIPIRRRNRNWPKALDSALARSLSRNWDDRHPSAMALIDAVCEALSSHTPFRIASMVDTSNSRFSSGEWNVRGMGLAE